MSEKKKFRYEKKYVINNLQMEELSLRMSAVCDVDPHAGESGVYNIRSLYFDDLYDKCYNDNEMGVEPRRKWRIRIYNYNSGFIRLERKEKRQGKIRKEATAVSKEFCLAVMTHGDCLGYPSKDSLVNRFFTESFFYGFQPKIIVEYNRTPFICKVEDVRVTFDHEISYSNEVDKFFEKDIFLHPVMMTGRQLLEVKYTEVLPSFIHNLLDTGCLQQCTFSKYYLSRKLEKTWN